jgi:hypothetical protein
LLDVLLKGLFNLVLNGEAALLSLRPIDSLEKRVLHYFSETPVLAAQTLRRVAIQQLDDQRLRVF